ncbi:MAG: hypothetical protein AB1599_00420 [Planctomycetota bacterium]
MKQYQQYINYGQKAEKRGDDKLAIKEYTKAIKLDPYNRVAYIYRALLYSAGDKLKKAEDDYTKLIDLESDKVNAYAQRANFYHTWMRDYKKAEIDYTRAIKITPGSSAPYVERGYFYLSIKKYDLALEDFVTFFTSTDIKVAGIYYCRDWLGFDIWMPPYEEKAVWLKKLLKRLSGKRIDSQKFVTFFYYITKALASYERENWTESLKLLRQAKQVGQYFKELKSLISMLSDLSEIILLDKRLKEALFLPPSSQILIKQISPLYSRFKNIARRMSTLKNTDAVVLIWGFDLNNLINVKRNICAVILGKLNKLCEKELFSLLSHGSATFNFSRQRECLLEYILDESEKECRMWNLSKALDGIKAVRRFIKSSDLSTLKNVMGLDGVLTLQAISQISDKISERVIKNLKKGNLCSQTIEQPQKILLPKNKDFPVPPGTQWSDLFLAEINGEMIRARIDNVVRRYNFIEFGCKDGRTSKLTPDKQWRTLIDLIKHNGEISYKTPLGKPPTKMTISRVAKILKTIFPISGSPFYPYKDFKSYKAKFNIEDISVVNPDLT